MLQLSESQRQALDVFNSGASMFLTGAAGTGKTVLIKEMVQCAKDKGMKFQVCATTGCAAVLLGVPGTKTVHSWAGIGLAAGDVDNIVRKVATNKTKSKPWRDVQILFIDEVSMLSARLFEVLDIIARTIRKDQRPFGGIQLVLSGDFYQLPPVGSDGEPGSSEFCFESAIWTSAIQSSVLLTHVFRQEDTTYASLLNQIRIGQLTMSGHELLQSRVGAEYEGDIPPTLLYPRRKSVDVINSRELEKLDPGTSHKYRMSRVEVELKTEQEKDAAMRVSKTAADAEVKSLSTNLIAEETLELRVGARVLCIANIDTEGSQPLVNGSQGVVTGFADGLPAVRFRNGLVKIVGKHEWVSETVPGVGVQQIPLILAWAITIHKAQGVTLELAEIDVGSGIFECGQTYVALSRVKSLEGLILKAYDVKRIKINKKVRAFYAGLA